MKAARGLLILLVTVALVFLASSSQVFGAAKEIQIKCGVPGALSELYVQGMLAIAEAVKTEGVKQGYDIKMQVFPNSSLAGGSQQAELELLQAGAIQMVNYSSANFAAFEPKISMVSMPFLFADFEDAYKFYSSPFVDEITAGLDKKGMKVLGMFTRGFRQLTNSKRPVRTLNDVKGLKVRVMNNPLYVSIFDALGAKAVPMSFSEVYTGLQLGTIDGQENSADTTKSAKVFEVQKFMTLWNYSTDSAVIAVSTKWWNGLDKPAQTLIMTAVKNEEKRQYTLAKQKEDEALASLKGSLKIETLDPGEQEKLRAATKAVWDKYENVFGKDLIDRVQKFMKK
jgi:tripartite ATP-independent transporter DctP family solute receptor